VRTTGRGVRWAPRPTLANCPPPLPPRRRDARGRPRQAHREASASNGQEQEPSART
jgi:hypothetical protein